MGIQRRPVNVLQLAQELQEFESRYHLPSDRMEEAFTQDGFLTEDRDFLRWDFVYGLLKRVGWFNE